MTAPLAPSRNAARRRALLASTSLIAAFAAAAAGAQQLPTGGSVASGAAVISQSGSAMTINQTSGRAIINWNGFSIGAGASVVFAQPDAHSATLNRVTGGSASTISGLLGANGQVYLVNPNGVLITRSGVVNTGGGFVASTLALENRDFNEGRLNFKGGGASAAVSNEGAISTGPGGFVGLIGGTVSNSGTINAPLGKVALGSGEQATLDLDGDGFLQVALPTDAKGADGKALIEVAGTVKAGSVAIKAATAANAVRNAINLSGYVSARSAKKVGGSIILGGGDGGDVKVSGRLDASGRARGGSISVTGRDVTLSGAKVKARSAGGTGGAVAVTGSGAVRLAQTKIDVSGATGGGSIAVGGGARGLGSLTHAKTTTVEASALKADAQTSGAGGSIAVWSDGLTTVSGVLTARGGAQGGDGGLIETSGQKVKLTGAQVEASAAKGARGLWLIDPTDFVIAASGGDATGAQISSTLNGGTNVTQSNADGAAGTAGDVVINDTIGWSSGATLTLNAFHDIVVNQNLSVTGAGGVVFNTGVGAGTPGHVRFALDQNGPTASLGFGAAGSLTVNGAGYTLLRSEADLAAIVALPAGNFAFANDIGLTAPVNTSLAANFSGKLDGLGHRLSNLTVNQGGATNNVGLFGGLAGGVVSNLFLAGATINGGAANNVGAIAGTNNGEIYNSGASGNLTGSGGNLGGLVGFNQRMVDRGFSAVNVTGTQVTGNNNVGGLVGANAGGPNSGGVNAGFASGDVTGNNAVGGLVGLNNGYVNGGASGNIVGNANAGGVVGQNNSFDFDDFVFAGVDYGRNGTVAGGYFFGFAFGTSFAGGVVGLNLGTVDSSFSNGVVKGNFAVGGLVGENDGAITNSYAIGEVAATQAAGEPAPLDFGGLVGIDTGSITNAFALGAVTGGPNGTNVGGLVGLVNLGDVTPNITNAFATGRVSGKLNDPSLGSFIGALGVSSTVSVTNGFFDSDTTGPGNVVGGAVGQTTAQLQGGATLPLGAAFTGGAAGGVAGIYPYLASFFPNGVHAVSGFAYSNLGNSPLASGTGGAVTVLVDTARSARNAATTGANGYYYAVIDAADLPAGANVLAYTTAPGSAGATYFVSDGAANTPALVADIHGTLLQQTLPASTTSYSQVVAGIDDAISGDTATGVRGVLAGVANINIAASAAAFNVDRAITPQANVTLNGGASTAVTISSAQTTNRFVLNGLSAAIDAPVTGTSVNINTPATLTANVTGTTTLAFSGAVTLGASVTLTSPSLSLVSVNSSIPGVGLTTSGAAVALSGNVVTTNGPITFGGALTLFNNAAIVAGNGAVTFGGSVDSSGDVSSNFFSLAVNAGSISFGGSLGDFPLGAVSLTSVAPLTIPLTLAQTLFASTTGAGSAITLNGVVNLSGTGTVATLVSAGAFINNVGAGAIPLTTGQQWQIFIPGPTGNTFNGLDSGNFAIWNTPYAGANVPATGNSYVFAFQPTLTFTSTNDAKTYGEDVTARVATDFTVSGLQPGVTGAYLADTLDRARSGAPGVTSAGSPATADVAGSPYAINVAQGTLAALNGYALAFASPGQLSVGKQAITVTSSANSRTYDATTAAAAAPTITSGTLFDAATLAETYATPNVGTGLTLNPTIAFANPAAANNYTVTLAPTANGVITAAPVTITASANSKTYDATTAAAATPTVSSGTLFDGATLSETYATPNAGTGLTLNPAIVFANPAVASNYAITLAPTANGLITPAPITVTATANSKVYDATTAAAATPTVTSGTLFDAANFAETYAAPNAGTGLTLNPTIGFVNPAAAANYTVTLAPTANGVITPAPITVTATANSKVYDTTTSAAATPTVTSGRLFDAATFTETYATPNAGTGLTLNPAIAFANAAAANNYTVTLAPTANGVITPLPLTITASPNTKTYDATADAAATPTVTAGELLDAATLSEAYATPNAGTGLTLNPAIAFANAAAAGNYAITLAAAKTGVINQQPLTIAATPFTKVFDGTTVSQAAPTLTNGTLFDAATLSQAFQSANPGAAINLIPSIAFANAAVASNYAITLVPTGVVPPNTGVILPGPEQVPVNLSPSVFDNPPPALGLPDFTTVCAVSPRLPDAASYADPAAAIQAISAAAAQYVERCRDASQQDIGNALDAYADALEVVIQKLPAKLRVQLAHIPRLVRAAAQRARVAPTRAVAVRVLKATVVAVQREIALVRADDPDSARIRAAVSTGVTGVLNSAALNLARAEGI